MRGRERVPGHRTNVGLPLSVASVIEQWIGLSLLSGVLMWAGTPAALVRTSTPRLVACTAPAPSALAFFPCPQPYPGEPTNLLGSCPDFASCGTLNLFLTTWTLYALLAFGCLCAVLELRGIPCVPLETVAAPKQQTACAQAFGESVEDLASLKEAAASY